MFTILKYRRRLIKCFLITIIIKGLMPPAFADIRPGQNDINEPKIDPKELIEKLTVAIIGVKGEDEPGSGVIVKKEDNVYSVLTSAHVVCNKTNQPVDTEEYALKTYDGIWHDSSNGANLNLRCPPILKGKKKFSSTFCSAAVSNAYPWPIDIALLQFTSNKEYKVAKRSSSIKRFGSDVFISGYPISRDGEFVIRESQGTVDLPPSSIYQTCKGYGLRYIAQTEIGMDGGGVWSKKGKLVGIHGYREVSRSDNIVLNRGSYSTGIHIPYWKQLVDPFNPSRGFPEKLEKYDRKDDASAIISKAKAFINVARSENINDNSNLIIEEASSSILEDLKRAEKIDSKRPLIPALIAQIYIRRYEDGSKQKVYLTEALKNINKAIILQKPNWLGPKASYDGSFEAIRAYVHFLYGQHINNQDSILSYRYAIKNIDERLSLKPEDVESWKDKAKYHAYAGQLGEAYASLIKALKLAPDDPSIYVDMGIILATNNEFENACRDFNRASRVIDEGLSKKGKQGDYAKDYQNQKLRIKPWKDYLKRFISC